jgi:selenocysteine lyase/cysteine desulfurase
MIIINSTTKDSLVYTNLKKHKLLYADYTGTGQPSPIIDEYITEYIYPFYANTHSNSSSSKTMTNHINKTREYIRKKMNLKNNQLVIFTGTGTTGAINHLVNSINYKNYNNINLVISLYEHHSNYLPWIEKSKLYKNITLHIIPLKGNGELDYTWYYNLLLDLKDEELIITSITACSNVSGIITDIAKIKLIIDNTVGDKGLLFVDYACLAPYKPINAALSNACFISPHKFIGGIATPGILIADESLFMNNCPYAPGGGCVKMANKKKIVYEDDIEQRETGGTPNIIGIIRVKLVLIIKELYLNIIEKNEKFILEYVHKKLNNLVSNNYNLTVLYLNKQINNRLPIICISLNDCHFNDIVKIMSNLFGIQTRGGISCCGLFGDYIEETMHIKGWCRITFHWLMSMDEIDYILNAIKYITINHKMLSKYKI